MTQWKSYHIDKFLYGYRILNAWQQTTFTQNRSIQDHLALGRAHYADRFAAFNKLRLENALKPKPPEPDLARVSDRPAFVVASKSPENEKVVRERLKGQDVFVAVGAPSILEAYEQGRLHWADRKRIVYVHDDVDFRNLDGFVKMVEKLPKGTHGPCGTADPEALVKDPWWECKDCHGYVRQHFPSGEEKEVPVGVVDKPMEVRFLDGVCLVTVGQAWNWRVPGKPKLWHGYDWLACKRTLDSGSKCFTFTQPNYAYLMHYGWGRMEGYAEGMKLLRTLARPASERRDYPNIHEHLPRLEALSGGNVLELGSRDGASTAALLEGVEKRGGFVWSVDNDPAWKSAWEGHPQWKFIGADSTDVKALKEGGVPDELDLLFIDTEHVYAQVKKEIETWGPKVKPGGVILLHDIHEFPEVRRAAEEYAAGHNLSAEFVDNCNGLGILRTKCPSGDPGERGLPGTSADLGTKDISYVIPVAAPSAFLERCVGSIRKWSPGSEVIVVANGCAIPPVVESMTDKIVPIEINARFGAGCNRGVMEASRNLVCILNDDAQLVDDTPAKLVRALVGGSAVAAPYCNLAKPPQGDIPRASTPATSLYPDAVVGVCMMMATGLYRDAGGFDPRLDTYEDDDLCRRIREGFVGARCEIVGGAWINHEKHATFKALGENVFRIMAENGIVFKRKHPRIKVVAIARNEERAVKGFFEQFTPVTRDWCLLDTGSTDKTKEIAASVGVMVEESPFENFSQARNEALKRFGKDADWVIMLDPDERLDWHTIRYVKELLFTTDEDVFLAPLDALYPNGSRKAFVPKPFLFRARSDIRWVFKVHEKLVGSLKQALVKNAMNTHVIALHEDGRRGEMVGFYQDLQNQEPYFTDPAYRARMREKWPILDYDRLDDARIKKVYIGPLVSAVIPTYKRPELLDKAIWSALNQDYANLEVVVMGDRCPTLDLERYKGVPRLRVYNLPRNHGAGGAAPRNHAITMAAGHLIAYLDDDNAWLPNHVSSVYEAMREKTAFFGFSSMQVDGKDMGFTEPKFQGIDTSCVVHIKDLVRRYGPWKSREEEKSYAHDWKFVERWVKGGEPWVCTKLPTLVYNAATSGQAEFLKGKTAEKAALEGPPGVEGVLGTVSVLGSQGPLLLSIMIPTIPSREESLKKLLDRLEPQAKGKPVEIRILKDDMKMTISEKRQIGFRMASGKYVTFIDDDDMVEPTYVDDILEALEADPDLVVFDMEVTGYPSGPNITKVGIEYGRDLDTPKAYYRLPTYLMVWRKSLAVQVPFRNVLDEDANWAVRIAPLVDPGKQVRIDKILYHYQYNPATTTQGAVQKILRKRAEKANSG